MTLESLELLKLCLFCESNTIYPGLKRGSCVIKLTKIYRVKGIMKIKQRKFEYRFYNEQWKLSKYF